MSVMDRKIEKEGEGRRRRRRESYEKTNTKGANRKKALGIHHRLRYPILNLLC